MTRFAGHLRKKAHWKAIMEQIEPVLLRDGEWTRFETAVWEQHFIDMHGGAKKHNPDSPLQNEYNAITKEEFDVAKERYGHNPCGGLTAMGWWRDEDGESIVGDGPVDLVMEAHRALEASRARAGEPPPTPDALFDAAARIMRKQGSGLPAPEGWPTAGAEDWTDEELPALEQALREVVTEYEISEMRRAPTAHELYETLDFAVAELG